MTEEEALHLVAAGLADRGEVLPRLHALCDRLDLERPRQLAHRADDGIAVVAAADIADERSVDLDLVELEVLQIAQGCERRTEIVKRDLHAESVQLVQDFVRARGIAQQHVFGNLELEPASLQLRSLERPLWSPAPGFRRRTAPERG